MDNDVILSVRDLRVSFRAYGGIVQAVRGVSFDLHRGETLAIVGESGSGKSVFTKSFIGMLDRNGRVESGHLIYHGEDMTAYTAESQWLKVRGK